MHVERVSALLVLGDVGAAQLNMDLALESYEEAERVLALMKQSRRVGRLWRELGDSWRDLGELRHAVLAYDRSFEVVGFGGRPGARGIGSQAPGSYAQLP